MFLFLFVVVYAFLITTKIFKGINGEKGLAAIIALAASFLVMMSPNILSVLTNMVPWLTLLVIFLFLTFFIVRMFAGDDEKLFSSLIRQSTVYWILIVILILVVIVSFSQTYGQPLLEEQLPDGSTTTYNDAGELVVVVDNSNGGADTVQVVDGNIPESSTTTDDFSTNVLNTIIHPKVLGMLMLLIIAFFAIIFLAKNKDPDNK